MSDCEREAHKHLVAHEVSEMLVACKALPQKDVKSRSAKVNGGWSASYVNPEKPPEFHVAQRNSNRAGVQSLDGEANRSLRCLTKGPRTHTELPAVYSKGCCG